MSETFDFIVVGGGSAGAVIAARLSEDPGCRVALVEAGERPPDVEQMPVACAAMQLNPATDWMYTADPGKAGLGLRGRRTPVPRGKMLGGSSGLNYMAYVRGHPGDFDSWAEGGATGWSYADVLPYFRKSEGLAPCDEIVIDAPAHNSSGPLGVSVRSPILAAAREFVEAAEAAGIPRGDYNGRDRGGAAGVVSLVQSSTRQGKRSSTYRAFLQGEAERRPNLAIITGAQVTRVLLDGTPGRIQAKGIEYRTAFGETSAAMARKEVIVSAGAVGSPHLLLLSGIGPRRELETVGVPCLVDSPHVGKHLKDHIQVPLFFAAPGVGVSMQEVALSMGPSVLRHPAGPLPADPEDDRKMSADLQALKQEAERRLAEWATTGCSLVASSLYDACAWFSTGLGDHHSHDAQIGFIPCGYTAELWDSTCAWARSMLGAPALGIVAAGLAVVSTGSRGAASGAPGAESQPRAAAIGAEKPRRAARARTARQQRGLDRPGDAAGDVPGRRSRDSRGAVPGGGAVLQMLGCANVAAWWPKSWPAAARPPSARANFRFPPSAETPAAIVSAVEAERHCCRFLRFRITLEPDGGPVLLELNGPPGTREFVAALLEP